MRCKKVGRAVHLISSGYSDRWELRMRVIGRAPLTKEESMAKTRTKKPSVGRKSGKTKRTSKRFVKFRPMNVVTLAGGQYVGDDHG